MPALETFQTSDLPLDRRLDFWNEVTGNTFNPVATDATDLQTFNPSLTRTQAASLRMGMVCSSPSTVYHSLEHVARTQEAIFFLLIQLEGNSLNIQGGREALLEPGDFTMLDATRPYNLRFDTQNTVLVVGIQAELLRRQLSHWEGTAAVRMNYVDNLNRLLSDFAVGFWRQCRSQTGGVAPALTTALVSLLATAYEPVVHSCVDGTARQEALRQRILHYIETHLGDSELSPKTIASALKMSPRYVHFIFTNGDETISRYIVRRRLEECARVLSNPTQRSRSVTQIAFDFGFGSGTNFGKVFREQYGLSPREYRQQRDELKARSVIDCV